MRDILMSKEDEDKKYSIKIYIRPYELSHAFPTKKQYTN